MKLLLFCSISFFHLSQLTAQTIEVTYVQVISFKGKKSEIDTADLKVSNTVSLFSLRPVLVDKSSVSEGNFVLDLSKDIQFQTLLNMETSERWTKDYVFTKPFLVYEPDSVINWRIISEKKMIGNYSAKKALGDFRGRKYTVWYTEEIPVRTGPWKLAGLPGLILEAKDDLGEIYYEVAKVTTRPENTKLIIDNAKTLQQVTWNEFKRNYNEKLSSFKKMLFAKSGGAEFETSVKITPTTIEKSLFQ